MNDEQDVAAIAGLVEDDCARTILVATREEPMTADALAGRCDVSEATVYRRLEELEEYGLVEETIRIDPAGNNRQAYGAILARLTFEVTPEGVTVSVDRTGRMADRFTRLVGEM